MGLYTGSSHSVLPENDSRRMPAWGTEIKAATREGIFIEYSLLQILAECLRGAQYCIWSLFPSQQPNKMLRVPRLEIIQLRLPEDNLLKVTLRQIQRQVCPTPHPNLLNTARQFSRKDKTLRLMPVNERAWEGVFRSVEKIIVDLCIKSWLWIQFVLLTRQEAWRIQCHQE